MKRALQALILITSGPVVFQLGCFNPVDFQAIAVGQFISFVNALINSVTSDAIRALLGV